MMENYIASHMGRWYTINIETIWLTSSVTCSDRQKRSANESISRFLKKYMNWFEQQQLVQLQYMQIG